MLGVIVEALNTDGDVAQLEERQVEALGLALVRPRPSPQFKLYDSI